MHQLHNCRASYPKLQPHTTVTGHSVQIYRHLQQVQLIQAGRPMVSLKTEDQLLLTSMVDGGVTTAGTPVPQSSWA